MTNNINITSFHRKGISQFALSVFVLFAVGIFFISQMLYQSLEQRAEADTRQWAEIIAARSVPFLLSGDSESLKDDLQSLDKIPFIGHVHVYKRDMTNDTISFFSSYNRINRESLINNFAAIPDKIDQLEQLTQVSRDGDLIELALPVNSNNNLIGYVYVQTNIVKEHSLHHYVIGIMVAVALFVFVLLIALQYKFLHSINKPLVQLTQTVQNISQTKNFGLRIDNMPYRELDLLAQKLNILLGRIEKHIERQAQAEQQIVHLNHLLEDKVNQRTEALKESNQELLETLEKLHQYQGQLVESEKMASLGDMVAGVAHEVNTPIGLGVTASSLLSDNLKEITQAFESKTLRSSQLKRFLQDSDENIGIIYRNLKRAADLISSFKKLAVDQSSEEQREFVINDLINEVILTLKPQLKHKEITFDIDCPEQLSVFSKPGPLNQVLVNLIMNSVIHGFEYQEQGIISIYVQQTAGQIHLTYKDDGKGVDESIRTKVFEPFITTKRGSGGSGLGLHLVYNLVTQALAGTIQFDTEAEQGVTFVISFPVTQSK